MQGLVRTALVVVALWLVLVVARGHLASHREAVGHAHGVTLPELGPDGAPAAEMVPTTDVIYRDLGPGPRDLAVGVGALLLAGALLVAAWRGVPRSDGGAGGAAPASREATSP